MQRSEPKPIPRYWETSGTPGPPPPISWRDYVDDPADMAIASGIAFALVLCGLASRLAAIRRGRAPLVAFVVGLVTGPVGAILYLLSLPSRRAFRQCYGCGGYVPRMAKGCRCGFTPSVGERG